MDNIPEINPNLEPMWTARKVADYLSLHPITIYKWISMGKIKYARFGRRVRIPKSEVERLVGEIKLNLVKK